MMLLIFMIIIHSSYGDDDHKSLQRRGLLIEVCNQTSDYKFCIDNIFPVPRAPPPFGKACEIYHSALFSAQSRANEVQSLMASLLENSSSSVVQPHARQFLERCQLLNNLAITYLSSANNNVNSDTIDVVVERLNTAANATKSCQGLIQATRFSELANKNSDVIKFCEISIASTKLCTTDDSV
ncbi:hypothetical protein REPUB_Repub02eG0270300 [Reevesia pubescens]